jgi:diguanylate cyclase (GGDEF)-like protein
MSGLSGPIANAIDQAGLIDPLTGLGNHRGFIEKVARLQAERAHDPAPFAIGIVDLDGFKPINDLFGRMAGDEILHQVGLRLRASIDEHSEVTRLGADEFAVLLPMTPSVQAALTQANRLIDILAAPYDAAGRTAQLSASVGCAIASGDLTPEMLISKAETALYHAKRSGRGKVAVYSQQMEDAAKRITRLEQALRKAVASGEVEPHFQPIVSLASRATVGFEALARWTSSDLGNVAPSVFIAIAEERGIIGALSQLVMKKALLAARHWPQDAFLSFNLSPSQLVDQNTGMQIRAILDETDFDPSRLEIEITETGIMTDPVSALHVISDLREAGVRVALDDFGTGQSSLGRLREFPFDKLKIDRSFVSSMFEDRASEHIIRAILAMCEGIGLSVVAEGIELESQARRLAQLGCIDGQGYLFGRPVDSYTTLNFLRGGGAPNVTSLAG